MKTLMIIAIAACSQLQAQSIVGTWQLTEEKTCFETGMVESETEKELTKDMGSSRTSVARVIRFDKKGGSEEGIFAAGKKKGTGKNPFKYRINDQDLLFMDSKSGIMTQHLVIDELSASTLRVHNAQKDCETKTFVRIK